jgi:hypothetical protein
MFRNALCLLLVGALISVGMPRLAQASSPQAERVQLALEQLGVPAAEAAQRVAALDEAELAMLAQKLEEQPAGQGFIGTVLLIAGVTFILLVVLDATGVTDVFPWIKKPAR